MAQARVFILSSASKIGEMMILEDSLQEDVVQITCLPNDSS